MPSFDPASVDVPHFLETLEIRNITQATAHEMRFSCPFPSHTDGDRSPSCYMNIHTSVFFCQSCKERGTAVDFCAHVLGVSPIESIRILKQAYMPGAINPDARNMVAEVKKILTAQEDSIVQPILDESVLEERSVDWYEAYMEWDQTREHACWSYMFERGFEPETLADWEFGYDSICDRPVFPVRDVEGRLIGFKGRAWRDGQHPKYLVLGDGPNGGPYGFPRYYSSRVVFGAHKVEPGSEVVVCEGELNAIATNAKTGLPAVAINGSHFSEFHAKIIRRIASKAILFLDTDQAGSDAVWGWYNSRGEHHPGIVDRLRKFMPVLIAPPHAGDAASMRPSEINACLDDAKSSLLSALGM